MTGFSIDRVGSLFERFTDAGYRSLDTVLRSLDTNEATKEALRSLLGTTQSIGRPVSWTSEDLMYRDIHFVNALVNKLNG